MLKRERGQGLEVSALSLGCMGYGKSSDKPWIVPLFGTRSVERFTENVGALSVVLLNDELSEIQVGAAEIAVEGARYPEAMLRRSGL
ncbi:aldo/keto reductase [Caballeronia catudaia]|uniref:Aldo/keto reductase n=1 Tax=Caballeronia catudaia TaxID=1777136 RepID=A0A158CSN6_9BURK|nr:hypothetical protein [Caballeronia catudaia]SAK85339.1 aldo/keto reductase [Caballeronia catudaia]